MAGDGTPIGGAVMADRSATRAQLIRAAAEALLLDEQTAVEMAGVETGKFVQTSRKAYRAHGFNFSDDDLRTIHETLRLLCLRRGLHRKILTPDDQAYHAAVRQMEAAATTLKRRTGVVTTTGDGRREETTH